MPGRTRACENRRRGPVEVDARKEAQIEAAMRTTHVG